MTDIFQDYTVFQMIGTFLVWIVASFIGAISWGGWLISIPFLIFLWLPPHIAIATNKFWAVWLSIGSLTRFWKSKEIQRKYVVPLTLIAVLGGYIWAKLLIEIDKDWLWKIVALVILCIMPFIMISKSVGIKQIKISWSQQSLWYILYFLAMIFWGFFGGWWGIFLVYIVTYFFWFTFLQTQATDKIPWLLMSVIALVMFIHAGLVNYILGIILFLWMFFWWYLGAHTALKKWNVWVKRIFIIVVIASAVKLLFF